MASSMFAVALISLIVAVRGAVVHLTSETFDQYVDGSRNILVEFYAPWCGHCKNLEPEWKLAGETFTESDDIVLAAFDATTDQDLSGRYDIKGFRQSNISPRASTIHQKIMMVGVPQIPLSSG